ncbi:hypothetical protein [Clostridium perfringens]|jgi:hypothetical protein|uniref:Uncharacterized protein n=1 Tax=Clostridium perfringens TaxID=1502 RepID=A0A6G4ZBK4_CLOPF|nr:hypothetical protein [Clostridium perfringens]EHK2388185.1 hypothetical protein [Clostridium perfringens]EHK2403020.1 hypothetical protein [Clostridium perfringens]EIF6288160.1 hypothetical protein [Clostridium perfringens]EJT5930825.1 hypothetical protein [Clostridium perfringens]EJT6162088.1 hypothetical protein [Clostridium perfringens]
MAFVFLLVLSVFILVVGILGISLLFFLKNRKLKNVVFYFLVIWSMLIACLNATGLPTNYIVQQIIAWLFGSISIIAIIIKVKKTGETNIPYILVTISVLLGIFMMFF